MNEMSAYAPRRRLMKGRDSRQSRRRPIKGIAMNRNHKPALSPNQAARIVSAVAAALLTWVQCYGVVSFAGESPMAIAGHQSAEKVAESTQSLATARQALASLGEESVAR
jgi:hypothetical protein